MTLDRLAPVLFVLLWSTGWVMMTAAPALAGECLSAVRRPGVALGFAGIALAVFPR